MDPALDSPQTDALAGSARLSLGWCATAIPYVFMLLSLVGSIERAPKLLAAFTRFSENRPMVSATIFVLLPGIVGIFTALVAFGHRRQRRRAAVMMVLNVLPWALLVLLSLQATTSHSALGALDGDRVNREIADAIPLCEQGHAAACLMIADAPDPQSHNDPSRRQYRALERGCELRSARACARLAYELQHPPDPYDPTRARALWRTACQLDRRECRDYVGMLIHGNGGAQDCALAWRTLDESCAAGDPDACDQRTWPWVTSLCPRP